jgi:uncharacterized iron-regulated protein
VTDEQRLQMITDQLILVRDNLFRGMSKSIQKLQARSINEVLELENFTRSPQRTWVELTDEEIDQGLCRTPYAMKTAEAWREGVRWAYHQLKEKNT